MTFKETAPNQGPSHAVVLNNFNFIFYILYFIFYILYFLAIRRDHRHRYRHRPLTFVLPPSYQYHRHSTADHCPYCKLREHEDDFVSAVELFFSRNMDAASNTVKDSLTYTLLTLLEKNMRVLNGTHRRLADFSNLIASLNVHLSACLGDSMEHETNTYAGRKERRRHVCVLYFREDRNGGPNAHPHPNVMTIVGARARELLARTPVQRVITGHQLPAAAVGMSDKCKVKLLY